MAGHHHVQQRIVGRRKFFVFLGEKSIAQQNSHLAFHGDVVAGHGLAEVGEGVRHPSFAGDQFGQFEVHKAPIWAPVEQGIQLLFCGSQVFGGHEPSGQLQLQDVAFREVPQSTVEELPQGFRICRLFDNAESFQPNVFVMSDLGFVVI